MPQIRKRNNKVCKEISQDLRALLKGLEKKHSVEQAILFGSFARGDYHKGSDIDLILVGNFKGKIFDRIGRVLDFYEGKRDLAPLVYNKEEFNRMVKEERPFIITALKEGIDLRRSVKSHHKR